MNVTTESLQQAWQRQALDAPRISLEYLRHRAAVLGQRARLRNGFEYVTGIAAMVFVIGTQWDFIVARPIISLGIVSWVIGMIWVMAQWHRRAVRQRDARRGNWRWWVPPLLPTLVAIFISLFVEVRPTPWIPIAALALWVGAGISLGIWGYERAARSYQREIDALDSLAEPKAE
jgi:hypothetical protein